MKWLSDDAVSRLRAVGEVPDLSGTKYRVLDALARGGMGAVYLVEDAALGRRVALKTLDLPDPTGELAARMLREAQIVARLEHPGIVPVHDVGRMADGRVFYAMKFVRGSRLDQHIAAVPSLADRLRIFQKVCDGVAFAHAHGVLHRDLKPENIMVGPFGEVLVMDWGVAKVLREWAEEGLTSEPTSRAAAATNETMQLSGQRVPRGIALPAGTEHGAVLGTPGYMAPEQARGEIERLDERTDVFALGAILRFLLTGRTPHDATTAETVDGQISGGFVARARPSLSGVPRPLAAVCAKAMSHNSADRYASAQDLAADVARFLDGLPVTAYLEGIFAKAGRIISRHRVAVILVLAYLVMRVLLLALTGR